MTDKIKKSARKQQQSPKSKGGSRTRAKSVEHAQDELNQQFNLLTPISKPQQPNGFHLPTFGGGNLQAAQNFEAN
jgi:hypothetical protein